MGRRAGIAGTSRTRDEDELPSERANERRLYRYEEELSAEELAELDELLPDEVIAHHLRWLETGEGAPWPESSG